MSLLLFVCLEWFFFAVASAFCHRGFQLSDGQLTKRNHERIAGRVSHTSIISFPVVSYLFEWIPSSSICSCLGSLESNRWSFPFCLRLRVHGKSEWPYHFFFFFLRRNELKEFTHVAIARTFYSNLLLIESENLNKSKSSEFQRVSEFQEFWDLK